MYLGAIDCEDYPLNNNHQMQKNTIIKISKKRLKKSSFME